MRTFKKTMLAAALCFGASLSQAQAQLPDAGRLLQENMPPPAPPRAGAALELQAAPAAPVPAGEGVPGAARTVITALRLEGLTVLEPGALAATIALPAGQALDLAGLRDLAAQVQVQVRAAGLPFARAYLPAQDLAGGVLRIAVVEGRYGQVLAKSEDAALAAQAQRWLAPLRPGEPIATGPLERSLLLLEDLPGVQTETVLRPGAEAGTGDLDVQVARTPRLAGEVGYDNYGNTYTGRQRVRAALDLDSPFVFGDQLSLRVNDSEQSSWLGSAAYSAPLGRAGLRALVSAGRSHYQLGKEFAPLHAYGTADVISAGLAWPLLRTHNANVRLSGTWQYKLLQDKRDALNISERKRVDQLLLVLSMDRRGDTSVSWGSVGLSLGRLHLEGAAQNVDAASARTQGGFGKVNFDVAHLQAFGAPWSVYARLSGQWSDKNLDSSEKFVLGGAYGVRAWASGEAAGDMGALGQLELRYRAGAWAPFAFVDAASVRLNRLPFAAGNNQRSLAGPGLGLRWSEGPWAAESTLAWRTVGYAPGAAKVQGWVNLGYRF